jgi:predicted ATPase
MDVDQPPVVRVTYDGARDGADGPDGADGVLDRNRWPGDIPAVQQLVAEGLDLTPGVTFLVGENGSGKSTIVEAVAMAYGLSPEGGTQHGQHSTRPTESALGGQLRLERGLGAPRWGFFLRAETMHGWYTFLEAHPAGGRVEEPRYHEMSHGESFLTLLASRFSSPGFYCLDEPEAALSFSSTLSLISTLAELTEAGGQVLCATHSPVLAALPGARILEVGHWGLRETTWEELELVQHWRAYLQTPGRYLRHVLG